MTNSCCIAQKDKQLKEVPLAKEFYHVAPGREAREFYQVSTDVI